MALTVAYWCVLVAALLPIACAGIAKYGKMGAPGPEGRFDNRDPRGWLARLTDWRGRTHAAQANSFEALPFFCAAVIIAHQLQAPQGRLDLLALLFVVLRILYIMLYIAGMANTRSAIWVVGMGVNIGILFSAS